MKKFKPPIPKGIHPKSACKGEVCCFHNPSKHHMNDWSFNIRESGLVERICPCGVGHPDPDSVAYFIRVATTDTARKNAEALWVHGCCGHCSQKVSGPLEKPTKKAKPKTKKVKRTPILFEDWSEHTAEDEARIDKAEDDMIQLCYLVSQGKLGTEKGQEEIDQVLQSLEAPFGSPAACAIIAAAARIAELQSRAEVAVEILKGDDVEDEQPCGECPACIEAGLGEKP